MTINETQWNEFIARTPGGSFLQSWAWGEFQDEQGVPFWRLTTETNGQVAAGVLVLKRSLPLKQSWLYAPRGPLVEPANEQSAEEIEQQLKDLAYQEGALFIRSEPPLTPVKPWRKAERDVQPRHTRLLNLAPSTDELLAGMHQKTRYNIRLAEKKGVTVRFSTDATDLDHFIRIAHEVSDRSAFHYHPATYYQAMLTALTPTGMIELAVAEHEGDVLAVHILMTFAGTTTYVHGASSSTKRALMAPHVLQWQTIVRAKERGTRQYDFYGIAPIDAPPTHPWAGITRFKEGFGGTHHEYPGAYDLVLKPLKYWGYKLGQEMRHGQ